MIDLGLAPPQQEYFFVWQYHEPAAIDEFIDKIRAYGMEPPDTLEPEKIHRFPGNGKNKGNMAGWCKLFEDKKGGVYGDFSSNTSGVWQARHENPLSPAEQEVFKKKVEQAKAERLQIEKKKHTDAAAMIPTIFENAKGNPAQHPYAIKKGVNLGRDIFSGPWAQRGWKDALHIPIYDRAVNITSIQAINVDGTKDFLSGGKIKGSFYPFGNIIDATGIVVIGEGLATVAAVCEVIGCPGVAAMNAGNLEAVAMEIRKLSPKSQIIIIADDDQKPDGTNPGKEAAIKAAAAIGGKWVIPDLGKKADAWDCWYELGPEGIKRMMGQARTALNDTKPIKQFKFISSSDLVCTSPEWIIKNYLEQDTTITFFGAPASMKTFVVMGMGLCVATGNPWHGHRVKQGPVLYICGEGKNGIAKRIQAWELHNKTNAPFFFISNSAAQMLSADSLAGVEAAAKEVAINHGEPVLLIIDTLNRNFGPGDENSTSDMTAFIQAVDQLRDRLKCAILIVHHSGLADANRGRGSSALRGAMDFEYNTEKNGETIDDLTITLTSTKTKDHESPAPKTFKPVIIDLNQVDDDGQPVTSLILEPTDRPGKKGKRLSHARRVALETLKEVALDTGKATDEAWRQEAYARGIAPTDTPDAKKKAFDRARTYLLEMNYVGTRDNVYWLISNTISEEGQGDRQGQLRTSPVLSTMEKGTDRDTLLRECPCLSPYGIVKKDDNLLEDANAEYL
jgi:phage/plasmid primase-like uncharacterized protein